MKQPPLLPEETLSRVVRIARFDGMGVLVLGSLFAVLSAAARDVPFAVIGLLAAGAGAVELHGVGLLHQAEPRGMRWLIASQPLLLFVILCYCALRLTYMEMPVLTDNWRAMMAVSAHNLGLTVEEYFALLNRITASVVAGVAFLYQGGMTWYYVRRRHAVERALLAE